MPSRPNTPCRHPGCPCLVPYGMKYCDTHVVLHKEDRASAGSRGYGSRWQKVRKQYLARHPLCVLCKKEGRYEKATVVDHVIPHRGDQRLFWDETNWQALCKRHHDEKTGNFDSLPTYRYPGRK